MNLSINSTPLTFQAKIKLKSSDMNVIKNGLLGTTAIASGVASIAAGVDSYLLESEKMPTIYDTAVPLNALDSTRHYLTSAEPEGLPVQSTVAPTALGSYGYYNILKGAELLNKNTETEDKKIPD